MVEVIDVVKMKVDGVDAGLGQLPETVKDVAGHAPWLSSRAPGSPSDLARRSASARVAPQHTGRVVDSRMLPGSRPCSATTRRK